MNDTWNPAEQGKQQVQAERPTQPGLDTDSQRRQDDGQDDHDDGAEDSHSRNVVDVVDVVVMEDAGMKGAIHVGVSLSD